MSTAMPRRFPVWRALLPIAFIVAFWLVFFWPVASGLAMFEPGDFTLQFLAFRRLAFAQFSQGRLPVLEECIYSGYPFQQDPQSQVLYPPVVAMMQLGRALGWGAYPLDGLQWEVMLHVLLGVLGMFAFLRAACGASRAASTLGGLAFAFGGYLMSYPILQTAILETAVWLPLILLFVQRCATRENWVASAFLVALLGAVAFTAGHPQTLVIMGYGCALAFVWWARQAGCSLRSALARGLLTCALLIGLAAPQLIPSASFMLASTRAGLTFEQAGGGFGLRDLAMFGVSGALATWTPLYVGVATLVLAFVGVYGHRPRSAAMLWVVMGALALALSLGQNAFGFELAYLFAPGYGQFQNQARHAVLVVFALATLAALGTDVVLAEFGARAPRRFARVGIALVLAGAAVMLISVSVMALGDESKEQTQTADRVVLLALNLLAMGAWFGLRSRLTLPRFAWGAMLVGILAFDLLFATRTSSLRPRTEPFPPNPLLAPIPRADSTTAPTSRVFDHFGLSLNEACVNGLKEVGGGSPIVLKSYQTLLDRAPEDVMSKLLNVRHTITWRGGMGTDNGRVIPARKVGEGQLHDTRANVFALEWPPADASLAWLVERANVLPDADAVYARMNADDFDPFREALVLPDAAAQVNALASGGARSAGVEGVAPGYMKISTFSEHPALLVISEAHHWNWRASVNGVETRPVLVDGALMGVLVPAGGATIELSYRPLDLWFGAGVFALTLLVGLGLIVVARRKGRPA